jgi:phospholipase C
MNGQWYVSLALDELTSNPEVWAKTEERDHPHGYRNRDERADS